jgi:hypothetical protein
MVADDEADRSTRSPTDRFLACWVIHTQSGLLVTPRMDTRRADLNGEEHV